MVVVRETEEGKRGGEERKRGRGGVMRKMEGMRGDDSKGSADMRGASWGTEFLNQRGRGVWGMSWIQLRIDNC